MTGNDEIVRSVAEETRSISLGTRRLVSTTSGHGSPVVVLESGLGAESAEWGAVQRGLSVHTRVCRYDRAGRGASDPAVSPRGPAELVADLRALLRRVGLAPPYVLVGHSFGGLMVRLFAQRHRAEVAGIVLVDAMHQDQFDVFGPLFPSPAPSDPPELVSVRAFWQGGWRSPDATREHIDFVTSIEQAREIASLGNIPLHVIIAGTFLNQPLIPAQYRDRLQALWQAQQLDLLKLSTRAGHSLALHGGHFLQHDAPLAVLDAIKDVIAMAGGSGIGAAMAS